MQCIPVTKLRSQRKVRRNLLKTLQRQKLRKSAAHQRLQISPSENFTDREGKQNTCTLQLSENGELDNRHSGHSMPDFVVRILRPKTSRQLTNLLAKNTHRMSVECQPMTCLGNPHWQVSAMKRSLIGVWENENSTMER